MEVIINFNILTLIFVTTFWICIADPATTEEIEDAQKLCQEEHGITDETFNDMRNKEMILEDESDETKKCLIQCMLVGLGMIKDGLLDVEKVADIARPIIDNIEEHGREVDEESLKSDIKNCTVESEEGKCTGSYETWKCLHGIMSYMMLSIPVEDTKQASKI